jgi:hypothetical protein
MSIWHELRFNFERVICRVQNPTGEVYPHKRFIVCESKNVASAADSPDPDPFTLLAFDFQVGTLIQVNEANFDAEVIKAKVPVIVHVYADWCIPCRIFKPFLARFAEGLGTGPRSSQWMQSPTPTFRHPTGLQRSRNC